MDALVMITREIKRIAFLQEYRNRPDTLKELIPEVADKGYHAVAFAASIGQEPFITELAKEAKRVGLEVMAFTGYMKYGEAWLNDHPEQRMVLNTNLGAQDQDRLSVNWGCPFNPEFQTRYFDFLANLGRIPNMTEVWINDEASLGFDEKRLGCYCQVCRTAWKETYGGEIPRPPFQDRKEKSKFVQWRFRRWNEAHGEMKEALNGDHPVRAVFLSSPPCCIGQNPWVSAVDIAGMLEQIDGVMTDPYYTFHDVFAYTRSMPYETYLSEYCRYLRGMAGKDKLSEICAQGFSHPTFTRPLDERDGWWAGVVPLALGINNVTAYTYPLQKISPMQKTYEAAFQLDSWFARTQPMDFVAVVDSLETQSFHIDAACGAESWQLSRMIPVADTMRHHALPYTYISSRHLLNRDLSQWPVIVLPGVSCLQTESRKALRNYVADGGILVACGETATRDETGQPIVDSFMEEVFGLQSQTPCDAAKFSGVGEHPAFSEIPWPDEVTAQYMGGTNRPVLALNQAVAVEVSDEVQTLACFTETAGLATGKPALTLKSFGKGTALFCAGIPERLFVRKEFGTNVLNYAGLVLARVVNNLAADKQPLRAKGFPPHVPMQNLRPMDQRRMIPTAEFMPCVGDNLYLATVASYFKEPMKFSIEAILPADKTCGEVRELTSNQLVDEVRREGNRVKIDVDLGFDDCIKVFAFVWV